MIFVLTRFKFSAQFNVVTETWKSKLDTIIPRDTSDGFVGVQLVVIFDL